MKIGVLVSSLRGGGAERVAVSLANAWVRSGYEVRLFTLEPVDIIEYPVDPSVTLVPLSADSKPRSNPVLSLISRLRRIRRAVTSVWRPDVLVSVQSNLAIESSIACLGSGLKIIGCEHNIPSRSVRGAFWTRLRPFAYRHLSMVVTLTSGAAVELQRVCGNTPLRVMANPLHLPLADNPPQLYCDMLVPFDAPLLLAAGRLVPAKGFDILLSRFARLLEYVPEARLVILGEGPLRATLEAQVRELGLEGKALLPGRAGNMAQWYARAQLFMMTSRWEGMPMVLIEAMGHGLVPVVTDFKHGPRDVIRPGVDGLILAEADEKGWVDGVAALLMDGPRRIAMGAHALDVYERFGEAKIMAAWDELLEEVVR